MRRTFRALAVAAAVSATTAAFYAPTPAAAASTTPASFSSVTAVPGPRVGEITFRWTHSGTSTTGYVLRTALSSWSDTSSSMARTGRNQKTTNLAKNLRSITLSAAQVSALGAPVGSGNHLYFRFSAVNKLSSSVVTRNYPYLQAVLPRPQAPSANHTPLRFATFNVRTARALTDKRSWLQRAPDVAQQIVQYDPGVVALQELGPGRADGQSGTLKGAARQTDSLLTALGKVDGGSKYKLVRTTPYVQAGVVSGTQGMRILYDHTKFFMRSACSETTGSNSYSSTCSIRLPILSTDTESSRRRAAFAEFTVLDTGAKFFFVSVHLDERHSENRTTEIALDALRKSQVETIAEAMNSINSKDQPIIIAGDMNSWQNNKVNDSPHAELISQGYYDTSAAVTRTNFQYSTINHFDTTVYPSAQGMGSRLDQILVKGATGASLSANILKTTDTSRPSDHNMVIADFAPTAAPPAGQALRVTARSTRRAKKATMSASTPIDSSSKRSATGRGTS